MKKNLTKEELAARLNGREYGEEITEAEARQAKEAELVVLFGYSDDCAEFRGAIYDEAGASRSRPLRVSKRGPIQEPDHAEEEVLQKFGVLEYVNRNVKNIQPIWSRDDISWQYETEIPHATFDVMEEGEVYCRGIVFSIDDL